MTDLRIGVIGVGHHGRHHARNLSTMPGVNLVGVVDANEATAAHIARTHQTRAFSDPHDLLGQVDGVCIAVPTARHYAVAEEFLKAGIATLVEKPLSLSPEEGRAMTMLARKSGATFMVGHIERFNPVWSAVKDSKIQPTFLEGTRNSRYPFRSLDVSVIFDVMIHDLDLMLSITGSRVQSVAAVGGALLSPSADWAEVRLEFANGAIANLSASRVHHTTERRMRISSDRDSIEVDFVRRLSVLNRVDTASARARLADLSPNLSADEKESLLKEMFEVGCVSHDREVEPLRLELNEFVDSIRHDREPSVTGEHGLEAVIVASEIDRAIGRRGQKPMMRESA